MWQISPSFIEALKQPVQEVRSKLEILDTDFKPVHIIGGSGTDKSLIDGMVDLDVSRGTRRTLTLSLLNEDGEFSPTSEWGGLFYVNRLIRLYRGLVVGTNVEFVPIGTFLIDKSEVLVERSMSTVIIAGSDLWKKFTKSQFVQPYSIAKNTPLNTIVTTFCTDAGVTKYVLDPLNDRTSLSKNIQVNATFEKGETRGDALIKIMNDYGVDIYFDSDGILTTEDTRTAASRSVVWSYGYTDRSPELSYIIRSVTDDERLYNHVFVTGTGNPETLYTAELKDTDPLSPTNINRIGDRVFRQESGILASQEAVNLSAQSLFRNHKLIGHTIAMEGICQPALEGNDVVEVIEPLFSGIATDFSLSTFNIPLLTSKQKITMKRVINL